MPPKKQPKSKEEQSAEGFFPVDEEDLGHTTTKSVKAPKPKEEILERTTQKPVKEVVIEELKTAVEKKYVKPGKQELETIEETFTKPKKTRKRKTTGKRKTTKRKSKTKVKEYKVPKISLKPNGYELIITEKPQAANKIANALGQAVQKNINKIPYYEVNRQGAPLVVACAVGHLFTLKQNSPGYDIPKFDVSWIPNFLARKADFTKKYYDTILSLAKDAGSITVATDFDVEGEVIGLNVVRFLCGQKDANRMKFSTLTKDELNKAYEEKQPTLEWSQAIAGETRHYLDWFYGINLSRALMNAIKTTGKFKIMSTGRVQGPSLKLIVDKEREISAFESETYWQEFITINDKKNKLELKHTKDIFKKTDLKQFENIKGKIAIAETKKKQESLPPNPPFNLTTLQTEAYKFYGIAPKRTLQVAQSLYLSGLISYPRTSSQKLPAEIGYKEILKKVAKREKAEHLIKRTKPIEGAKTDPAHPSIYPTGNFQKLTDQDAKIYNLITARFLSLFCEDALIDKKTVRATVEVENNLDFSQQGDSRGNKSAGTASVDDSAFSKEKGQLVFSTRGSAIARKAWLEIYPSKLKETEVPDMQGECKIIDSRIEEKQTQPPKRFSPASILSELEKRNLGTKCLTKDTSIIFNGKKIKIENLFKKAKEFKKEGNIEIRKINGKIISLEKEKPIISEARLISKRKLKDKEKIIKIETDSSAIKITEDHLIYIFQNGKIKEIKAKHLKKNNELIGITKKYNEGKEIINKKLFDNKYKIQNNEIVHKFASKTNKGILVQKIPIKWSTPLAWILGYFYGDGSYDSPEYNGSHSISFCTTSKKALNLLKKNSKIVFGVEPYAYDLGTKYKVNCNATIAYSLIKSFPKLKGKKLLNIPKEFIGDFLRGFFDADGNVHLRPLGKTKIKGIDCNSFDTPRVKITLAKKELIEWISNLLKELGIKNKINKGNAKCKSKNFDCWTILISGRDKIEKFAYKIGFDSYKEEILIKGLKCKSPKFEILRNCAKIYLLLWKRNSKIEKLTSETGLSRYKLIMALRRLCKLKIINKKRYINRNKFIYSIIKRDLEYLSYCIKIVYEKISKDIYKIPIKNLKIINYNKDVYDISVKKDSPNFITEGNILVHNSTRANILETLYDRGYVKDTSITATPLGVSLIETMEKHSPIIIDEELTRNFEVDMDKIREIGIGKSSRAKNVNERGNNSSAPAGADGRAGGNPERVGKGREASELQEKQVIEKAKEAITKIAEDFEKSKEKIGKELLNANLKYREQQKQENKLVQCPKCKKGDLAITYSKRFKRQFIACDAYPDCKNTFSLPPKGTIKKTDKQCDKCGFPLMMSLQARKKPWFFCFNTECETNKERIEKYKKKLEDEGKE